MRNHVAIAPLGSKVMEIGDIEVAIFDQHRTSFFHWARWRRTPRIKPPILVTLDRHSDYSGYPEASTLRTLRNMKRKNMKMLSLITWQSLCKENDDHIMAAAYMNFVGDIYVLEKSQPNDILNIFEDHHDRDNNTHKLIVKGNIDSFISIFCKNVKPGSAIYLDIDLDYFTNEGDYGHITVDPYSEIVVALRKIRQLMIDCSCQIRGITIALEPAHCGSIKNSHNILRVVDFILFNKQLIGASCSYY